MDKPWVEAEALPASSGWPEILLGILFVVALNLVVVWLLDRRKRPRD